MTQKVVVRIPPRCGCDVVVAGHSSQCREPDVWRELPVAQPCHFPGDARCGAGCTCGEQGS